MSRNLVLAGIALASILVAVILFRPPDTGSDIPQADIDADPVPLPEPVPPPAAPPSTEEPVHNTKNAAIAERRAQPDAMLAARESSVWTGLRRELLQSGRGPEDELVTAMGDLVRSLRDARLNPDKADHAALRAEQDRVQAQLAGSDAASRPGVQQLLGRLDDIRAEYATPE